MSSSSASTDVPVEQPRNTRKTLKFPDWPSEVISMKCKQFHAYCKDNKLTPEQKSDLLRVRRREQGKRAAKRHRERVAVGAKPGVDKSEVFKTNVVDYAIKRARAAADAIAVHSADGPVNHLLLVINFLQKEAELLQTDQDAAEVILQLSGGAHAASAPDEL